MPVPARHLLCVALASVMLGSIGCTRVTHHGDAVIIDPPDFPFVAVDTLRLPEFSIDTAGAVYRWEVRDLPYAAVPEWVTLHVTDPSRRHYEPWENLVLAIELRDAVHGTLLHEHTLTNSRDMYWNYVDDLASVTFCRHEESGADWTLVDSGLHDLPLEYDVIVRVIEPSTKVGDTAWLESWIF